MNLYAESSAILAWLLDESSAQAVRKSPAVASHWHNLRIAPEIVDRARQPFPGEPIRTLDSIHLASVLTARTAIVGLKFLSLDDRIRKAAKKLGLELLPE